MANRSDREPSGRLEMQPTFEIRTSPEVVGEEIRLREEINGHVTQLIFSTRDDAIRKGLVELGWTPPGEGWRPIETAPKDGTRIIAIDESGDVRGVSWGRYYVGCWLTGRTLRTMNAEPETFNPIGWMPLPDPPKLSNNAG